MSLFSCEADLVDTFRNLIASQRVPASFVGIAAEFDYRSGRTDLIAVGESSDLFAFEAKMSDWRTALHQAYRGTSFSHYSYVVLPDDCAEHARAREPEFLRRRVGLCTVSGEEVFVLIDAARSEPLQPWLTDSAREFIKENGDGVA